MPRYEIVDAAGGNVVLYIYKNDATITIEDITELQALEYIKLF